MRRSKRNGRELPLTEKDRQEVESFREWLKLQPRDTRTVEERLRDAAERHKKGPLQ